ncbi:hypothetical protein H0H93_006850 [Arthromyces matolae]|nr:hypothetical protein H0H93_006850 [Arthromyces matolae]
MLKHIFAVLLAQVYCVAAWNTFVVPHVDGQDDMPSLVKAIGNYTTNSTILFEHGVHYNIFSPIKFPVLNNVEIRIEGNLSYPTDIPTIQATVGSSSFPGSWFTFTGGNNVTLRGSTDPNWGWIDGHGQAWWDTQNQVNRPHGFAFAKISNGVIRDMKIWKPIAWVFSTSGANNLHVFNNQILAASNNPNVSAFPFNTIENVVMKHTLYGARFKSWTGGNGFARNVTWRNIAFENVRMPIYVTQNYWDQGVGPRPNSTTLNNTHVEDFLFQNFVGTVDDTPNYFEGSCVSDPCWYYVANATGREVIIFDLYPNTATNIVAKDIFSTTKSLHPVTALCDPTTITNDVGFKCWDGLFIPTKAGF